MNYSPRPSLRISQLKNIIQLFSFCIKITFQESLDTLDILPQSKKNNELIHNRHFLLYKWISNDSFFNLLVPKITLYEHKRTVWWNANTFLLNFVNFVFGGLSDSQGYPLNLCLSKIEEASIIIINLFKFFLLSPDSPT